MVQGTPTNAPNEGSVPVHERRESSFFVIPGETFEKLPVRQSTGCVGAQHATDVPEHRV
jgi:hypothetical protein